MHRSIATAPHRLAALLGICLAVLLAGCGPDARPASYSPDIDARLAEGRDLVRLLPTVDPDLLSDEEVVALGYLERSRLGIGSPFRLVEFVRADARLDPDLRRAVTYGIIADALDGGGYAVDPAALDQVRFTGSARNARTGEHHLRLIEEAIARAPTAASGEEAVRLAYVLAATERTVSGIPESVIAHAAAQVADRRRAREDAAELLQFAAGRDLDPLEVITRWREERRFRVERPALTPLAGWEEAVEAETSPRIALEIRTLRHRLSAPAGRGIRMRRPGAEVTGRLSVPVADRLLMLAEAHDYPPQAPISVAVMIHRGAYLESQDLTQAERDVRSGFVDSAWNEERIAAAASRVRDDERGRARVALMTLQAAVFMRAWNQEVPWMPGDPGPPRREVEARFGLERITFDPAVPEGWHPYYLRMLSRGFGNLHRILPTASIRGLAVHFGEFDRETHALALHDPRTRTLVLPPRTGAGTLAHEIGHDLDWQLARRRYNARGYATDIAQGRGAADRIATSVAGLTASLHRAPGDTTVTAHDTRPTEVFARGMDWFVAAALARDGLTGGYLTSFQDPALTGYGTTRGPDVGGNAPPALFAILDHIAPVVPEMRDWALSSYGPLRQIPVDEVVRTVVRAGWADPPDARFARIEEARRRALQAIDREPCRVAAGEESRRLDAARIRLLDFATEVAVRGAVADGALALASLIEPDLPQYVVHDWLAWRFHGAPEPQHPALDRLVPGFEGLAARGEQAIARSAPSLASAFHIERSPLLCDANPFAAISPF